MLLLKSSMQERLVDTLKYLEASFLLKWLKLAIGSSPIALYFSLSSYQINPALQFIAMSIWVSIIAFAYLAYIYVDILKAKKGNSEIQRVAAFIEEGAEGYVLAQYRTIFKLSILCIVPFVIIAIVSSIMSDSALNNAIADDESNNTDEEIPTIKMTSPVSIVFLAISFLLGVASSAFVGFSTMLVSIHASFKYETPPINSWTRV